MDEVKKKVNKAMIGLKNTLRKKVNLNISKIEVVSIKPMSDVSDRDIDKKTDIMLKRLTKFQKKIIPKSKKEITREKREFKNNLKKIVSKNDYLIGLKWTIQPTAKKIESKQEKEFDVIIPIEKETIQEESFMIFNSKRDEIKFDSLASNIPTNVEEKIKPPKKSEHHSTFTQHLDERTVLFYNAFGMEHSRTVYNAKATYYSNRQYATELTYNDFGILIEFNMRWDRILPLAIQTNTPIAVLGYPGSFCPGYPGTGSAFDSKIYLTVPTDFFESGRLEFNDDNGFKFYIGFSLSYFFGVSITPVFDTSHAVTLHYTGGPNTTIKHIPKCGLLPPMRGIYYNKGRIKFETKIFAKDSLDKKKGWIGVNIPVYYGFEMFCLIMTKLRRKYWGSFDKKMDYKRDPSRQQVIGNRRTYELHIPGCVWHQRMNENNKIYFKPIDDALNEDYNGCHYCLRYYDKG